MISQSQEHLSNMKKTINLILVIGLIIGTWNCTSEIKSKPNVILVITDDQGYGDIAAHGNDIIKTPHLDELHGESVRLTNFHVDPTCAPTRAALMTGRYAVSTGVWHTIGGCSMLRDDEKTLSDMFSENGYNTGGFGKWHLGDNYPFRPYDRGFQHTVMHGGGGVQQTPDYWGNDYFDDTYLENGKPKQYQGYCTDVFFDEAISFIEDKKDEPFFCYIAANAAHSPFNVPLEYVDMYKDVPESELTKDQKHFYGMITNIDDNIGKLRNKLEELGIADNTILIFMADNGTALGYSNRNGITRGFNDGMRGTKASKYDGGHRVPFFIYWKNGEVSGGTDFNDISAHIDIMPTLAGLCNIPLPTNHLNIDGSNLSKNIKEGKPLTSARTLITDSQRIQKPQKWRQSSVMTNQYRLIDGKELYDMNKDPGQSNDIAVANPEIVSSLRADYESWWSKVSTKFDEEMNIPVGTSYENPVILTAHDWHAVNGTHPWNQEQILSGHVKGERKGYWSIDVTTAGDYEINLSRYPEESNLGLNDEVAEVSISDLPGLLNPIPAGVNMNITSGWLKVRGQEIQMRQVDPTDKRLSFKTTLKEGASNIMAGFINEAGEEFGAYYVYVKKV